MDSLFPPSKLATRAAQTAFLKMRASAAEQSGGAGNCEKQLFIGLTSGIADPRKCRPFAYKYSARSSGSASTSSHFPPRLERACLGRERALPKQTRSRKACTCMSAFSDVRIRTPRHALMHVHRCSARKSDPLGNSRPQPRPRPHPHVRRTHPIPSVTTLETLQSTNWRTPFPIQSLCFRMP